ncbi:unnamed protein product [Somion occarium]|uniref:Peptidase A1 domain-containing protein n=1 Tax=Somion occarium TaxID=3059160 RepID=A0ABP1E8R3_9APHY
MISSGGLSSAAPSPNAQPLSVPLLRRYTQPQNVTELGAWARNQRIAIETKYGIRPPVDKRSNGMNLLTNQNADSSYFGSIAVGTPPVSYDVILDTGSADFWLAASDSEGSNIESDIPRFSPPGSSSFVTQNASFSIRYGSGAAQGTLGSDVIQMAGFEVQNQVFGVVSQVSENMLNPPVSGILGLAWENIATSQVKPFWQVLAQTEGLLDEPVMAFQLTRYIDAPRVRSAEPGGTFTLGATNSSLYEGDIDYQNIPDGSVGYWILEMSSLLVQNQNLSLPEDASFAAIDTGTTLVGGPAGVIQAIYSAIPGSSAATGEYEGYYTYPCSTTVTISLGFGNSTIRWPIEPAAFRLARLSADTCLGGFFELSSSGSSAPNWIVGDVFLKNVYSVFRASSPPAIGFATLSSTALAMNGEGGPLPSPTIASSAAAVTATGVGIDRASSAATRIYSTPMGAMLLAVASTLILKLLQ